ncbi:MAG: aminoacyl-tRNA hydrolase, partial [Firmicutes bacterium]|nr:aminoacyl-tRNA hydrolase [Bacillota bacterium]
KDGSAGGHNGLKSVIAALGTEEFPRLRVGVGAPEQSEREMIDWVLGKFQGEEAEIMAEAVKRAADAVECIMREGIDMAMGKYN